MQKQLDEKRQETARANARASEEFQKMSMQCQTLLDKQKLEHDDYKRQQQLDKDALLQHINKITKEKMLVHQCHQLRRNRKLWEQRERHSDHPLLNLAPRKPRVTT